MVDKLNPTHNIVVCGLSSAKERLLDIKDSWVKDIRFFVLNCFKDLDKADLNTDFDKDPLLDLK